LVWGHIRFSQKCAAWLVATNNPSQSNKKREEESTGDA